MAETSAALRTGGAAIEYVGALVVPDDELAYHVFAAADAQLVREAATRAGLRVERLVPSLAVGLDGGSVAARRALSVAIEVDGAVGHATSELGS